jgi:hypothetical protein
VTALSRQPANPNSLNNHAGRFVLKRAPNLNFFCQEILIPEIQVGTAEQQTELDVVPRIGDSLNRGQLSCVFKIDEDLKNYAEIWNWMVRATYPDSHEQYADLVGAGVTSGEGPYSDITVIVGNSAFKPKFEFRFQSAFPESLSGLRFQTTNDGVRYHDATVAFTFRHFTVHSAVDGEPV